MTTKQILEAARALIGDRSRWTEGSLQTGEGQFCALGAIAHVTTREYEYGNPEHQPAIKILAEVIDSQSSKDPEEIVFEYNDERGYDCTIAAFDAAIERA